MSTDNESIQGERAPRISVETSPELSKALRVYAARHGTSMARVVEYWIRRHCMRERGAQLQPAFGGSNQQVTQPDD